MNDEPITLSNEEEPRPIWIPYKPDDERLKNHCSYLVSDGKCVTIAWFDVNGFVGCENDLARDVSYWMPFPKAPKNYN